MTKNLKINYLVNNAGFGIYGEFVNNEFIDIQQMIHLYISSLTKLTKFFLNNMKKERFGRIMNVASVASFQPGPLMSIYSATKHYVLVRSISRRIKWRKYFYYYFMPRSYYFWFQKRAGFHSSSRMFKSPLTLLQNKLLCMDIER